MSVFINSIGINSALGLGLKETAANLFMGTSPGMLRTDKYSPNKPVYIGTVGGDLPSVSSFDKKLQSRNNQLLLSTFQEIEPFVTKALDGIDRSRVAIIIGTSTSGISDEEEAFLAKFAKFVSGNNLNDFMETFNDAYYHIERNANTKLLFTDLCFKVMRFIHFA